MVNLCLLLVLLVCLSCGKKFEDDKRAPRVEEASREGTYSAILYTVNPSLARNITGEARVSHSGDDVRVSVRVHSGPELILEQGIHTGTRCPTLNLDTDRDGKLSLQEGLPETGYIILPLDGDLSSQLGGQGLRLSGRFEYQRTTSYSLLLSDLKEPDDIVNDEFVKLEEEDLRLGQKVITVYTTINGVIYPLACGVLSKIYDGTDDFWDQIPPEDSSSAGVRVPRRRPGPGPSSGPPEVKPPREPPPRSWWDRLRQRWRSWRDRWSGNTTEKRRIMKAMTTTKLRPGIDWLSDILDMSLLYGNLRLFPQKNFLGMLPGVFRSGMFCYVKGTTFKRSFK